MTSTSMSYNLSINTMDALLDISFPQRAAKKDELNELISKFANSLIGNEMVYAVELASDPKKIKVKIDNIIKKSKIIDPKSYVKIESAFDKISHNSTKLTSLCKKFHVSISEYNKFIKRFGGDINGTIMPLLKTPIICAIEENNVNMLSLLAALDTNLDKCSGEGISPLGYAIFKGSLEMVEILKKNGADMNRADNNGFTPLTWAIVMAITTGVNAKEMIKKLHNLGADLDKNDKNGYTSLAFAVENKKTELVNLLLDLGADIDKPNGYSFTPIALAISQNLTDMADLLGKRGADRKFAMDMLKIKFLGQVWGLRETSTLTNQKGEKIVFNLERHQPKYIINILKTYTADFFNTRESASLSGIAKKEIEEAVGNCYFEGSNAENVLARIQEGKPAMILGGAVNHTIAIVMFHNKMIVCNRGLGKLINTVTSFELPAHRVTKELIDKLSHNYGSVEMFNSMLDSLKLPVIGGFQQKDQKADNCSFASAKSAVAALFREYTDIVPGYKIYKALTRFIRKKSLEEYLLSSVSKEDPALLKAVLEKAGRKGLYSEKLLRFYGSIVA